MAVLKCKMCGGDIVVNEEKTYGMCDYCGSTMTLPKVSNDQRAARFNRGNHFRRQGDFDKALAVYETIVNEDDADAEAHWCCALCRFGIEYVEDPNTFEYLPTCHRASFDSFLEDPDYLAALDYSDGITRRQYQRDAAKIAAVQRGILATSQNEEPYDVFICYKETDDSTKERTRDSLDAQEIYYQLTQEGYRVFFSRITLEDKAGAEYEPYIFAALNSAKVMISIGSKPEYFNAVWVKNEWSRFIAMMRNDRSKLLLPCYKNMDPYDLPEQLGVLQSYDMTKIGFIQDLIRGVNKVLRKDEPKAQQVVAVNAGASDIVPLTKRMFMYLEDGEWDKADEYNERVLDKDPENAEAYLGKLMVDLEVRHREDLKNLDLPFDDNKYYQKAVRFADEKLKAELISDIEYINNRNAEEKRIREEDRRRKEEEERREEEERKERLYNYLVTKTNEATTIADYKYVLRQLETIQGYKEADSLSQKCQEELELFKIEADYANAVSRMNKASTEAAYRDVADIFKWIVGYKDADVLCKKCLDNAEICRKEEILADAKADMQQDTPEGYRSAMDKLNTISGWNNADELLALCEKRLKEYQQRAENCRKDDVLAKAKTDMQMDTHEGYRSAMNILDTISGWKDADELFDFCKKKIKEFQQRDYKDHGLCRYCGGSFKGVFTKKCSLCGKTKDY